MIFCIDYDSQPEKFLEKLDKHIARRIVDKIGTLTENPYPQEAKRLQDYNLPTFRIRIGKYRVLYRVDNKEIVIVVIKIDKRDRVYD
jgi:mRNA interferase RelE/StbE